MNALLIYPGFPDTHRCFRHARKVVGKHAAQPPLGLMTVAPLLPGAGKKRLVDTNLERLRDRDLAWATAHVLTTLDRISMPTRGPTVVPGITNDKCNNCFALTRPAVNSATV